MRLQAFVRPLLIGPHQARIARHVGGKDRGETADRRHVLPGGKGALTSLLGRLRVCPQRFLYFCPLILRQPPIAWQTVAWSRPASVRDDTGTFGRADLLDLTGTDGATTYSVPIWSKLVRLSRNGVARKR